MNSRVDYQISVKENLYFFIKLIISIAFYYFIVWAIWWSFESDSSVAKTMYVVYTYLILIVLFLFFRFGVMIGYIRGNAVKLTATQFPDIYKVFVTQSEQLQLAFIPTVYIMQSGGVLNAFATKFMGRNYVVLYSEMVETYYQQDKSILEFVIGHELGHIKRNHMLKKLLLMPSSIVPFLGSAYSRACEYTCDNIGHALCPSGAKSGIVLLASGRGIYKMVNVSEFVAQDSTDGGFWKWFAEKISSHPTLVKRLAPYANEKEAVGRVSPVPVVEEGKKKEEVEKEDYSRYMPL
jgi:Zn-dependent protease with chaperone function